MELSRNNNGDLVRLLLALGVVFQHAFFYASGRLYQPIPFVGCFLVLSGYLVLRSRESSVDAKHFLWKRLLRIYPPLILALVLMFVLGRGQGIETLRRTFFIGGPGGMSYWTITLEEVLYGFLVIAFAFGFYRSKWFAWLGLASSIGWSASLAGATPYDYVYLYNLIPAFFVGNLFHLYKVRWHAGPALLGVVLCLAGHFLHVPSNLVYVWKELTLAYPVLYFAFGCGQWIRLPGDFSYGLFLYHVALIPMVVAMGVGPMPALAMLTIGGMALAALSWFGIEKPLSRFKDAWIPQAEAEAKT